MIWHIMFFDRMYFFNLFFSSQNFKRGGALAPSMDAPPLVSSPFALSSGGSQLLENGNIQKGSYWYMNREAFGDFYTDYFISYVYGAAHSVTSWAIQMCQISSCCYNSIFVTVQCTASISSFMSSPIQHDVNLVNVGPFRLQ